MNLSILSSDQVMIGNAAGWALTFHTEAAGTVVETPVFVAYSANYEARLTATLPAGLEAGAYSVTIEGLTDGDYAKIAQNGAATQPSVARLYLYWLDANSGPGAYLANLVGLTDVGQFDPASMAASLVAEMRITKVSRAVGARHYEATIEGKERVFHNLSTVRIPEAFTGAGMVEALTRIGRDAHIAITPLGFDPDGTLRSVASDPSANQGVTVDAGQTYDAALRKLAQRMEEATGKYGRGLMVIRNGTLHFGVRGFPLSGSARTLAYANGLLKTEALDPVSADPDAAPDSPLRPRATRRQFKLTLKGRPDLKPGDMAIFDSPPEDLVTQPGVIQSLVGTILPSLGGDTVMNPINLYVTSVTHAQGRATGFVTTVTGVEISDLAQPWDRSSGAAAHAPGRPTGTTGARADGAASAASVIRQAITAGVEAQRTVEIGEVRGFHDSGTTEPVGQTELVWRGLVESDGLANQARRLNVQRIKPAALEGTPYASPFAWGKCGLVLPRYPGTRVVLAHRNGKAEDPIDIGALWTSAHGPASQPGDYWLILPAEVAAGSRAQVADTVTPAEFAGKVTNDLIDADGNRTIEVGELTVRVGHDQLGSAGTRPQPPDDRGAVTIEHAAGGSSIVMKQDGSITITGQNVTIDAGNGTITMKANTVDVQVQSKMNVH